MSQWRYIATRMNGNGTETVLSWDVPLKSARVTDELSGPGRLTGSVAFDTEMLRADGRPIFEPWSTAIYAEIDGQIRYGYLLIEMDEEGPNLLLDCGGFTTYPEGMPYTGEYAVAKEDPLVIVRHIWSHLQGKPQGNLGVTLDSTTSPIRVGALTTTTTSNKNPKGANSTSKSVNDQRYRLAWYQTPNLGTEIDSLARETPFDYRMKHSWATPGGEAIRHHMELGYPTLGKRQTNLRFVLGENIFEYPKVSYDGDDFANEVLVVGAGEGRKSIRAPRRKTTTRLRRAVTISDKSITAQSRANSKASTELKQRMGRVDIQDVVVINHPHAEIGTFAVGDEILIQSGDGWTEELALWVKILAMTIDPEAETVRMTTTRVEKVTQ